MHVLGRGLLLGCLVLAALAGTAAVVGRRTGDARLERLGRRGVLAVWACTVAASALLLHLLLTHDFSNEYVVHYSDSKMHWAYLIASFWGGQAGSLLFWALLHTSFAALAVHRDRDGRLLPYAIGAWMAVFVLFDVILIFLSDPFEQLLVLGALTEGEGLNPLLLNPTMTFHPPTILGGYAIWAVPFGYAVSALVSGRTGDSWVVTCRRWLLAGWILLTLGNLFGAYWAYEELGWGGYWGWDPVENASLLPWLTATALLHSAALQLRRGLARTWTVSLVLATFVLTIFGTFLTRTGLVQSVHAFASGGALKVLFLVALALLGLASVALVLWRLPRLRAGARLETWLSREGLFVVANVLLVLGTAVVLWGTLFPTINEALTGRKLAIGPPWFDRFMAPVGLALLGTTGLCQLLAWGRATARRAGRAVGVPALWGLGLTLLLAGALRGTHWFDTATLSLTRSPPYVSGALLALVAFFLGAWTVAGSVLELLRTARARARVTGEALPVALVRAAARAGHRHGGLLAHLGMALLFVGFAGGAFKVEQDVGLEVGRTARVGDIGLRLLRLFDERRADKTVVAAEVDVTRRGRPLGTLRPERFLHKDKKRTTTTEVDYRSDILEDVYLALVHVAPSGSEVVLKVIVNPLMAWMYAGTVFLVLGGLVALLAPAGRRRREGT